MFGRKRENARQQSEGQGGARAQENPYLSARAEYGDRYGAAVNEAARWRQISFVLLLLCLAFGGMMIWLSSQNKVIPYVVQVDKQGYTVAIGAAEESSNADTRVVIAALGRFIVNFKSVVVDPYSQRYLVDQVFNYLASGSAADAVVSHYYRENNPFEKQGQVTQVEIHSILPIGGGGRSWQILWVENNLSRSGEIESSTEWRAIVSVAVSPVQELPDVLKNPLGIYITELNMAQDIVQEDN